jgi:TolA-binding protein
MRKFLLSAMIAASAIAAGLTAADAASKGRVQHTVQSGSSVQYFAPSYWLSNDNNPRLSNIEEQLNSAERRINADQRHGYLTAAEARVAREQGKLIRTTTFDTIKENYGNIPDASYRAILERVDGLDQTIQMETTRG